MPMIYDMKRAMGVMAVLAVVIVAAAVLDDDWVLTGNGCPVGTDRWATVGVDFAADDAGFATKADAVLALVPRVEPRCVERLDPARDRSERARG